MITIEVIIFEDSVVKKNDNKKLFSLILLHSLQTSYFTPMATSPPATTTIIFTITTNKLGQPSMEPSIISIKLLSMKFRWFGSSIFTSFQYYSKNK